MLFVLKVQATRTQIASTRLKWCSVLFQNSSYLIIFDILQNSKSKAIMQLRIGLNVISLGQLRIGLNVISLGWGGPISYIKYTVFEGNHLSNTVIIIYFLLDGIWMSLYSTSLLLGQWGWNKLNKVRVEASNGGFKARSKSESEFEFEFESKEQRLRWWCWASVWCERETTIGFSRCISLRLRWFHFHTFFFFFFSINFAMNKKERCYWDWDCNCRRDLEGR